MFPKVISGPARARDSVRMANFSEYIHALEMYFSYEDKYPDTLDVLASEGHMKENLEDPLNTGGSKYIYCINANKNRYAISTWLEKENNGKAYEIGNLSLINTSATKNLPATCK